MDENDPDDEYFSDVKGIPDQQETIQTKGSSNQWNFSYGANFKDMLFLGAGIGVSSLRYTSEKNYGEDFADDDVFNNLALNEYLEIKGNGINATIGAIVRPQDFLQIGVSSQSDFYGSPNPTAPNETRGKFRLYAMIPKVNMKVGQQHRDADYSWYSSKVHRHSIFTSME